jgi:ABC-type branched-subunit amino acid transport system ATPase component
MKTILGIVKPKSGTVTYGGTIINNLATAERVKRGIAPVPEARRLFPRMTVLENLEMGCAYRKPHPGVMPRRNRLSWQDDRAVLLRSGRPGIAIQVEGAG